MSAASASRLRRKRTCPRRCRRRASPRARPDGWIAPAPCCCSPRSKRGSRPAGNLPTICRSSWAPPPAGCRSARIISVRPCNRRADTAASPPAPCTTSRRPRAASWRTPSVSAARSRSSPTPAPPAPTPSAMPGNCFAAASAERVLAGGYDGLNQLVFSGFDSLQALSPTICRPFDAHRDGLAHWRRGGRARAGNSGLAPAAAAPSFSANLSATARRLICITSPSRIRKATRRWPP